MPPDQRFDVLLIAPEWPTRPLLAAQFNEEGFRTATAEQWPPPRDYLKRETRARLVVVDLQGLSNPKEALAELGLLFGCNRVVVIDALGSVPLDELRTLGVHVIERPATVRDIVARARTLLEH